MFIFSTWEYARENHLTIVSKDNDFQRFFTEYGYPPAVVKLSLGNCNNKEIKDQLIENSDNIKGLSEEFGLLIIGD